MKSVIHGFIFIYSKIKKFFFNCFCGKITRNSSKECEKGNNPELAADEYHAAYSNVTRWQTL